jgi:two-component system, NtrC family, response regulator AtoC
MTTPTFSAAAMTKLCDYHYPGNIRELRNVVDRACAFTTTGVIEATHILLDEPDAPQMPAMAPVLLPVALPAVVGDAVAAEGAGLRSDMAAVEKSRILQALEASGGNQTKAADALGMPRRTLVARLTEYGLTKPRSK